MCVHAARAPRARDGAFWRSPAAAKIGQTASAQPGGRRKSNDAIDMKIPGAHHAMHCGVQAPSSASDFNTESGQDPPRIAIRYQNP
jgi:hypothetical protein